MLNACREQGELPMPIMQFALLIPNVLSVFCFTCYAGFLITFVFTQHDAIRSWWPLDDVRCLRRSRTHFDSRCRISKLLPVVRNELGKEVYCERTDYVESDMVVHS